ncbi:MAG: hypothetical protein RIA09_09945 [Hoeflea sp.]|uniref:hypothetical protein n=1 Tax=Hoeflea sp. TaxID=1940281 RepID=UPI0032ECC0B3
MTTIRPFFRGYRQALRDAQHTTECYTKEPKLSKSVSDAFYTAAETSAFVLRELRSDQFAVRWVGVIESTVRSDIKTLRGITAVSDREAFGHGYRNGFDRALKRMTEHAWRMNNPNARIAILELVMRYERVRLEIASDKDGNIRTLRARKFCF